MKKVLNFKTSSKFLLNAITKAPEKKKKKVFKDKFAIYKKRMIKNAESFFKTDKQAKDFEKYTLNTIEEKIASHLKKGKYDQKELQRQISGVVTRSRNYQKQVLIVDVNEKIIKDSDKGSRWFYIITHPIKTIHSDECAQDLANQPTNGYTKAKAEEIMTRKPNHLNCTCRMEKAPEKQTSRRFEQGNI